MKKNNLLLYGFISIFIISILSCSKDNVDLPQPNNPEINDPLDSSSIPDGRIIIMGSSARKNFLGAGYDITTDFLSNSSLRSRVIDLEKLPEDMVTTLAIRQSDIKSYEGKNAHEMLSSMMKKNAFEPIGSSSNKFFTETITGEFRFSNPYEYSSQFTFVCEETFYTDIKQRMPITANNTSNHKFFSDRFIDDLENSSPKDIIELYGTHVIRTANLGYRIRSTYRSMVIDKNENVFVAAFAGLETKARSIYKLPYSTPLPDTKENDKNFGGAIITEFFGWRL